MADNVTTLYRSFLHSRGDGRECTSCGKTYHGPTRRGRCNACRSREAYGADLLEARTKANKRASYLRIRYNMTPEDYDRLLDAQDGVCQICKTDEPGKGRERFCVDHDHQCCPGENSCGACVRGLLCAPCNVGLANFRDNPVALANAIAYLLGGDGDSR